MIQVFLAFYNSMLISARNTLLIGKITDQNDLCEFIDDLKGCLQEATGEITRCVAAIDGGNKATVKQDLPDYNALYDDQELKAFAAEKETNKYWLDIGGRLSKLNDKKQAGDIVKTYGRNLITCVQNDGCKAKLEASDSATDAERMNSGLDAGSTLAGELSGILTGRNRLKVAEVVGMLGPFIGALGPFAAIVGTFSDSPEVQLLNQVLGTINKGFERIENKLDVIENSLNEIKRKIDKSEFKTEIRRERNKVILLKNDVDLLLYRAPKDSEGKPDMKAFNAYLRSLKDNEGRTTQAKDALVLLYKMFTELPDQNTSPSWCERVRGFSEDHRDEVMTLSMEYFNIWLLGAQSYLFTLELRKDVRLQNEKHELEGWAKEILTKISECEEKIINVAWKVRWKADIQHWAAEGGTQSASNIANNIYQKASGKYYWRDWLVVVYTKDEDYTHKTCMSDDYTSKESRLNNRCYGHSWIQEYVYYDVDWRGATSWVVHVLSVDGKKAKTPNLPDISRTECGKIEAYTFLEFCVGNGYSGTKFAYYFDPYESGIIYDKFPSVVRDGKCKAFVSSGVVRATDFAVRAKSDRHKSFYRGGERGWYGKTPSGKMDGWWDGVKIGAWYFG